MVCLIYSNKDVPGIPGSPWSPCSPLSPLVARTKYNLLTMVMSKTQYPTGVSTIQNWKHPVF